MYLKIASLLFIVLFTVFCFWNRLTMNRIAQLTRRKEEAFWARERMANSVRRKPIDHLDYIKIPDDLHFDLFSDDNAKVSDIASTVDMLRDDKILNLTGYTNTDLKIMYGTANITALTKYDNNYTTLITSLQKWAEILLDEGYEKEAVEIMEFLVSTNADIGQTYRLLGKYYKEHSLDSDFEALVTKAQNLKSLNNSYIAESLREIM